jgi:predicted small secreted protein
MKKLWLGLAIGLMVMTLSACETMKGVGRDMEDAGEWVQEKAN